MKKVYLFLVFFYAVTIFSSSTSASDEKLYLMWQVHPNVTKSTLIELKRNGFNTLQSFSFLWYEQNVIKSHMELAERVGFRVIPYIGSLIVRNELGSCTFTDDSYELLDFISRFPALFAWQTFDEAHFKKQADARCQEAIYTSLKTKYPHVRIMISLNNTENKHYQNNFSANSADVIDIHAYANPIAGTRQTNLFHLAEKYLFPLNSIKFIYTLRAFNDPSFDWNDTNGEYIRGVYNAAEKWDSNLDGYGFYGWDLSPNIGLRSLDKIREDVYSIVNEKRQYLVCC